MKLTIKKIKAVKGFMPTTYAIYADNGQIVKIFTSKKDAEQFVNQH